MNILLIGMPCSGKTTTGEKLAKSLNTRFIDSDIEIEASEGATVFDIITNHGEAYFRAAERAVITQIADSCDGQSVIATGGGTVESTEEFSLLKRGALTVYLKADALTLYKRSSIKRRPLCVTLEDFVRLTERREKIYSGYADVTIDASGSPEQTFEVTLNAVKAFGLK